MSYTFFEEQPFEERYNTKPPPPDSNKIFIKNLIIIALSVSLAVSLLISSGKDSDIERLEQQVSEEYNSGYNDGERCGFDAGYDEGYVVGCKDGEATGEQHGFQSGYREGHSAGYDEGYREGWYYHNDEYSFYHHGACVVTTEGYRYHRYGCYHIEGRDYWIYNVENAERLGYTPCLDCWAAGGGIELPIP